jgi:hypothetical protein
MVVSIKLIQFASTREQSRVLACFCERRRLAVVAWSEGALGTPPLFQAGQEVRVRAKCSEENKNQE